jgi:hypothetical protein
MLRLLSLLTLFSIGAVAVYACGGYGSLCPAAGTPEFAEQAAALRSQGPAGLEVALRRFENATDESDRAELSQLVDQVAGQRDAAVSRLYWYTDLDQAQQVAAEAGRPILSLRMLGKLTDEFSCANSRFFRTALYANKEISDYLRDNFILHWQSVRPVPRVTVDFGDGRKLERTITGNSAHYILDAAGQPIDALPGLYGPQAFRAWLVRTKEFADRLAPISSELGRFTLMQEYHTHRGLVIDEELRNDLAAVAPELLTPPSEPQKNTPSGNPTGDINPTALQAAKQAFSKSSAEVALIAPFAPSGETLAAQNEDFWRAIAARHLNAAVLDESSRTLVSRELPRSRTTAKVATAPAAGKLAISKGRIEDPLLRVVLNFQESMALDTVKNEYTLHRQIHDWFATGQAPADVDALNERVYAELFLTPSSDPWLGLAPDSVYTALDRGGLTETQAAK